MEPDPSQISNAVGKSKSQAKPHSTVRGAAQAMLGAVVSTTVTVWVQVTLFVQRSVAFQMRVAKKVLPHNALVRVSSTAIVKPFPEQLSMPVGVPKFH